MLGVSPLSLVPSAGALNLAAIRAIRDRLRRHGAQACHEHRVLRLWSQALPQDSGRRRPQDFLPLAVRADLPALVAELDELVTVRSQHPAADGSCLLYTSPSPRDRTRSRMPSSA